MSTGLQQLKPPNPDGYLVLTQGDDGEEPGLVEILGEYVEKGTNHGRQIYQKISQTGDGFCEVYLYFWDRRDGIQLEGWWFGDAVGGTQVWSHCSTSSVLPPSSGWKIPFDGPIRTTLQVVAKEHTSQRADERDRAVFVGFLSEVQAKLLMAEFDVGKAEAVTALLAGDRLSQELLQHAEESLSKSTQQIAEVLRLSKELQQDRNSDAANSEELSKMDARCKAALERLERLKASQKEAREHLAVRVLRQEVHEKIKATEDAVERARVAEAPFLESIEDLPQDWTSSALKECEAATTAANTTVTSTRMLIATKLVEVRRFTSGPGADAQKHLAGYQARLEACMGKLSKLKKAAAGHQKKALMRDSESYVAKAEALVERVSEKASIFADDPDMCRLSPDENRQVCEDVRLAANDAQTALDEARQFVKAKQIELGSKNKDLFADVGTDLSKLQTRLTSSESTINGCKKLAISTEERLKVRQVLEEVNSNIDGMEEKVRAARNLVAKLTELTAGSEMEIKHADAAVAEAGAAAKRLSTSLESQSHHRGYGKEELARLRSRVNYAQECMNEAATTVRERGERFLVNGLLREVKEKLEEVKSSVNKACLAEAALLNGTEELSAEAASTASANLAASTQAAHTVVSSMKKFLATKKLNANRFSTAAGAEVEEELARVRAAFEVLMQDLNAIRTGVIERKQVHIHTEAAAMLADAEKKLQDATTATAELIQCSADPDLKADAMKASYDKARTAQAEASLSLQAAREHFTLWQHDAKTGAMDASIEKELGKFKRKADALQWQFDKQKSKLVTTEHRFVARRLMRDMRALVAGVEQKFARATESIANVAAVPWKDFAASIFLEHCIDALRARMRKASCTFETLLVELGAVDGEIMEAGFVKFLVALPELQQQHEDFNFSEEDIIVAFGCIDHNRAGKVSVADLWSKLNPRYVCCRPINMTDSLDTKEGEVVRKLEEHEALEALEAPVTDEMLGLLRVKARAEKDGKVGFVTLTGTQGTVYLTPCSAVGMSQNKIEKQLQDLGSEVAKVRKHVESKNEELKAVPTGPLAEIKGEISKIRARVLEIQPKLAELKDKFEETQKKQSCWKEVEKKRRQQELDKQAALVGIGHFSDKVDTLLADVDKVLLSSEALAKSALRDAEASSLQALQHAHTDLQTRMKSLEEVQEDVKVRLEETSSKGVTSEARTFLVRLRVRLVSAGSKCKKQLSALEAAKKFVADSAYDWLVAELRAHAQRHGLTPETFCKAISLGEKISVGAFRAYLAELPDVDLKVATLDTALKRFSDGNVSKLRVAEMLQEYLVCVKEIGVTTLCEKKDSKTVRKLELGEVVEVFESNRADKSDFVPRVRCRALLDSAEGWVTVKGNQGTKFLSRAGKPYYFCKAETTLRAHFESSSKVDLLRPGDVFEVLEGPREESTVEVLRIRVKASKDGKMGWVMQQDANGDSDLRLKRNFTCKASTAMTADFDPDAKDSFIRKIWVDEALDLVEHVAEVSSSGLHRAKMRTEVDGVEGWVTLTGDQGTEFIVEGEESYVCARSCRLDMAKQFTGHMRRMLEEGEPLQVLEGPISVKREGTMRVRGRSLRTGVEGWCDLLDADMIPWSVRHSCIKRVPLVDCSESSSAKDIRAIHPKEHVEALDVPSVDETTGVIRIRVRAEKDDAHGFVAISDEKGHDFFVPILLNQ